MMCLELHIGGQLWEIHLVGRRSKKLQLGGRSCVGVCDPVRCRIYISKDQDQAAIEDTLLHELLHATLKVTGADEAYGKAAQVEEDIVRPITPVLHRLLLDLGFSFPSLKKGWSE